MTTDNSTMPPIPRPGESGPQVCSTVRLYLAVLEDLPFEQAQAVLNHVYTCPGCTEEYYLLNRATRLVASLPGSTPSARVDQAVRAAIATHLGGGQTPKLVRVLPDRRVTRRPRARWLVASLAAAALILLAVLAGTHISGLPFAPAQAFALPQNLSWSGYVLYHSETMMGKNGVPYQVDAYHDLGTGQMHVETKRAGTLDVVAVGDDHQMLGLDMMHHVAQWKADNWSIDDSMFDLAGLRADLKTKQAAYLGKGRYNGQDVYQIRCKNGLILLLDMHYHPVNVLSSSSGGNPGAPMYDSFKLLPASQVPNDMWDMRMPSGFQMGTLPPKP